MTLEDLRREVSGSARLGSLWDDPALRCLKREDPSASLGSRASLTLGSVGGFLKEEAEEVEEVEEEQPIF